ncbi:hypothetical protein BGZ95_005332, partial [Linnemannia exigua]
MSTSPKSVSQPSSPTYGTQETTTTPIPPTTTAQIAEGGTSASPVEQRVGGGPSAPSTPAASQSIIPEEFLTPPSQMLPSAPSRPPPIRQSPRRGILGVLERESGSASVSPSVAQDATAHPLGLGTFELSPFALQQLANIPPHDPTVTSSWWEEGESSGGAISSSLTPFKKGALHQLLQGKSSKPKLKHTSMAPKPCQEPAVKEADRAMEMKPMGGPVRHTSLG